MFDRVQRGDPLRIRAETWNSILDVVERAQRVGLGAHVEGGAYVWAYCPSDADAIKFGRVVVLEHEATAEVPKELITDNTPHTEPLKAQLAFSATTHALDLLGRKTLGIAQEYIAPGSMGRVCVKGLCIAAVCDYDYDYGEPIPTEGKRWGYVYYKNTLRAASEAGIARLLMPVSELLGFGSAQAWGHYWLVEMKGAPECFVVEAIEDYNAENYLYPFVQCRLVLDSEQYPLGEAFYVLLSRYHPSYPHVRVTYPNVRSDDRFDARLMPPITVSAGGENYTIEAEAMGGKHLDAPIGAVRLWDSRVTGGIGPPAGWEGVPGLESPGEGVYYIRRVP